jgi:hypothetical protein
LGSYGGVDEVVAHPFFKDLQMSELLEKKVIFLNKS